MVINFLSLIDKLVNLQKVNHSIIEGNEAQTRWMLIDPLLLNGLGYDREDIIVEYSIDNDSRVGVYTKVDYSIMINNQPKIIVESKSLGVDIYSHHSQLKDYFNNLLDKYSYDFKSLIGILTDGDLYLFYTNSVNVDKMDDKPYFTIRLSQSEDNERLNLLNYSKINMLNQNEVFIEEEEKDYKLKTSYRIDIVNDVYNYFMSQCISGEKIVIDKVYLKGRLFKIKSFIEIYMTLLNEINALKPNFLYNMALNEDLQRNKNISSAKFSLETINAKDKIIKTKAGDVHIGIPVNNNNLIERIVYLVTVSNYGMANVLISFNKI